MSKLDEAEVKSVQSVPVSSGRQKAREQKKRKLQAASHGKLQYKCAKACICCFLATVLLAHESSDSVAWASLPALHVPAMLYLGPV